jgi:hypothetical protein
MLLFSSAALSKLYNATTDVSLTTRPTGPSSCPKVPSCGCRAPESPTTPRAASAPPAATDSPPPREWLSSPTVYAKRPRQPAPTAPMGPASTPPDRRPPTAVLVTPPMNPHRMVTPAKASFRMLPNRLILAASTTPVDLQAKLAANSGPPVQDASQFWSIAGALQYLTFTRPDIAYAVQQICLHMHDPREPHLTGMKRILRYLQGTPDYGLLLHRSSRSDLIVYTDADWAGCLDTRRSTSGYALFLGTTWFPGRPSGRPSSSLQR